MEAKEIMIGATQKDISLAEQFRMDNIQEAQEDMERKRHSAMKVLPKK
jgi:hypothetical protein